MFKKRNREPDRGRPALPQPVIALAALVLVLGITLAGAALLDRQLNAKAVETDPYASHLSADTISSYFLSKWYLLVACLAAGALAAGLLTYFLITPKFTATAKLYMVSNSSDTIVDLSDFNIGNSLSSDYEELLQVRPILEQIIEEEDLTYTYEELKGMLTISTISSTRILVISAVSTSPAEAMTIANALADKAVEEIPVLMDTATPNIAERAVLPTEKSSPSMKKNVLIGGILGLLLMAGILTILFVTDDTMVTAEDVQKKLGLMPLTIIPEGDISARYNTADDEHQRHGFRWRRRRKTHA